MVAHPTLGLHLSDQVYCAGRQLSGVVVFSCSGHCHIRSITLCVTGREMAEGASMPRAMRAPGEFFERGALLAGIQPPRFTSERIAQMWKAFLGREPGHSICRGEHVYPFSIALPASLPPSYSGSIGRIQYKVVARAEFPLGRVITAEAGPSVAACVRSDKYGPISVCYDGCDRRDGLGLEIELTDRSVAPGGSITGRVVVRNPSMCEIRGVAVDIEMREWFRQAPERDGRRELIAQHEFAKVDANSVETALDFELPVPESAPPTVEGSAFALTWLLRARIESDPPLKIRTPVTICRRPDP